MPNPFSMLSANYVQIEAFRSVVTHTNVKP